MTIALSLARKEVFVGLVRFSNFTIYLTRLTFVIMAHFVFSGVAFESLSTVK